MPPGAAAAAKAAKRAGRQAEAFNADERATTRESTAVVIGGVTFRRRRKAWSVSRAMRQAMRDQEKAVALSNRIRTRVAEHEVKQIEAAQEGNDELEAELEGKIEDLITKADEATETAEVATYRLLALLLIPQLADGDDAQAPMSGWGPDGVEDAELAIAFLQDELDVEDAAGLAQELTGSAEPDPPETPSSGNGST